LGILRGRLLHAYLAQIAWLPARGEPVPGAVVRRINRKLAPGSSRQWLEAVHRDLVRLLGQPKIAALFRRPANGTAKCWRERPFIHAPLEAGLRHDSLVRGVVDRVVLVEDRGGQLTSVDIVDFKTGAAGEHTGSYHQQLALYRSAVGAMTGVPDSGIRARIAWLDCGSVEDL